MKRCGVLAASILAAVSLRADTVVFGLNQEFSGGAPPASTTLPWLRATFNQVISGVELTLEALNLVGTEFVSKWGFNLNPIYNPTTLTFSLLSGTGASSITQGVNCCKADGDGYFDFQFNFATSGANRFGPGTTAKYLITGISGLSASSFAFFSATGGGNGIWYSAAHVQGIATSPGSGWIGAGSTFVPEPSSYVLFGTVACLLGLGVWRRRAAVSPN